MITGEFYGTSNLGGTDLISAGMTDVYLAKYAGPTGLHLFSVRYGSTGADRVGACDSVSLVGTFADTINLGGSDLSSAGSGAEVVIATFSAASAHLGSARQGGTGQENGMGIAVASDGHLYCVGHFEAFAGSAARATPQLASPMASSSG